MKRCQFCGERAVHPCSWRVEKPTSISHWDLEESHVVVTHQTKRELRPLTVRRFNVVQKQTATGLRWPTGGGLDGHGGMKNFASIQIPVTMYALRFPDDRYFLYYLYGRDRVNVLNPGECENACCEAHLREVGENTRYCMAHWNSWMEVAA